MGQTHVGRAFGRALLPRQREALDTAGSVLLDQWYDDIAAMLLDETDPRETAMAELLPPSFRPRFTVLLAKSFHVCLGSVLWRLAQSEWTPPLCLAEEIVLYLLIQDAQAVIEIEAEELPADPALLDFGAFKDAAFEDGDVEYLFDPKYDGIDRSPQGRFLGIGSQSLADAFRPYYGGGLGAVHPYCDATLPTSDEDR